MIGELTGDVAAQIVNRILQMLVKHVAGHRHAALHPLSRTPKFWVVELRHAAIAVLHGQQHMQSRIG